VLHDGSDYWRHQRFHESAKFLDLRDKFYKLEWEEEEITDAEKGEHLLKVVERKKGNFGEFCREIRECFKTQKQHFDKHTKKVKGNFSLISCD